MLLLLTLSGLWSRIVGKWRLVFLARFYIETARLMGGLNIVGS